MPQNEVSIDISDGIKPIDVALKDLMALKEYKNFDKFHKEYTKKQTPEALINLIVLSMSLFKKGEWKDYEDSLNKELKKTNE